MNRRLFRAELLLESGEGFDARGEGGFFGEEDGDTVADGIAEAAGFGDEFGAFEAQGAAGDGTAEHGDDFGVEGLRRHGDEGSGGMW